MTGQILATTVVVAVAAAIILRRALGIIRGSRQNTGTEATCGSCNGCSGTGSRAVRVTPLVQLGGAVRTDTAVTTTSSQSAVRSKR